MPIKMRKREDNAVAKAGSTMWPLKEGKGVQKVLERKDAAK